MRATTVLVAMMVLLAVVTVDGANMIRKKHRESRVSSCPGTCQQDSLPCAGSYKSGLCSGAATVKCCEKSGSSSSASPAPAASVAIVAHGVDMSTTPSAASLACFLDPKNALRANPTNGGAGQGPNFTPAQLVSVKQRAYPRLGLRYPLIGRGTTAAAVAAAIKAGYTAANIGLYFISFKASGGPKAGTDLIDTVVKALNTVQFGTLWLDIEGSLGGSAWTSSTSGNCAYLTAVVTHLKALQKAGTIKWNIGIYSGISTWTTIVGKCAFDTFSDLPFWFAAYTGKDDFSYWKPMAGAWQTPAARQWRGTTNFCGASIDLNIWSV